MTVAPSPWKPDQVLLAVNTSILAILVVTVLHLARAVLIPLALAVLLTFILAPVVARLQRLRLGRLVSVLLVGALVFVLLGGTGLVITLQMRGLANDLPGYQKNITDKIAGFQEFGKGTVLDKIHDAVDSITTALSKPDQAPGASGEAEPQSVRVQSSGFESLQAAVGTGLELLATAGLVTVLVVFMLVYRENLRDRVIRLLGHSRMTDTTKALDDAGRRVSRYLVMQLLVNFGFGLAITLGLYLIRLPYAPLFGFLAGILRFVPYVGSSIAGVLLLTFSVAAFPGWTQPLLVAALFVVLEVAAANVVEPLLFGHTTGVSPVALLVAAVFWTWLWGPAGLLLSTPLTVCLVVLGENVPRLAFFGMLLGDQPALEADVGFYQRLVARDQDEAAKIVLTYTSSSPPEQVYDDLLVPAMTAAKRDRLRDALSEHDEQSILQAIRDIVADLGERQAAKLASEATETAAAEGPARAPTRLLGLPARDEGDRLALDMLAQLLDRAHWEVEVLSEEMLSSELVSHASERAPAVLVIAVLPPGGLARARYLCKRLRSRFSEVKVIVGRWGLKGNEAADQEELRAAGADQIETTLVGTRAHLTAWLPVLSQQEPSYRSVG